MKVSDIMVTDVASLTLDDTVAKALSVMIERSVHQLPLVENEQSGSNENNGKYVGMVFIKHLISSNAPPTSKLNSYAVKTPALTADEDVVNAAKAVLASGNRALPVVERNSHHQDDNGKLVGLVSETDIAQTADFGHAIVDEVMSGAIVIEEDTLLADAMSKMRRFNISRLPVINKKGGLRGVVSLLDVASIISNPKERSSKSGLIPRNKQNVQGKVKVKDIMHPAQLIEHGTKMNELAPHFKRGEEVVVVGNDKAMGIVTAKDALELILPPKNDGPAIHMAHLEDDSDRRDIEEQLGKFIKKIQGKLGDIQSVVVYADKHKTRKYSIRCRLLTAKGVINAKAVGYDPISASKELIMKLDRQIKSMHTQKVKGKVHGESIRRREEEGART